MPDQRGVLLLAHGTVEDVSELPQFLTRVRRGRPPSADLVSEMRQRYEAIGGSPLLQVTERQAAALQNRLGVPCRVAMRLWSPEVEDVVPEMSRNGVRELCLLPMAPFSVDVYARAARAALEKLGPRESPRLFAVEPWGRLEGFVDLQVRKISEVLRRESGEHLILTAHSLPRKVIAMGDAYAAEFEACARLIAERVGAPWTLAYQSQGADGGDWLGPSLEETMARISNDGFKRVVVAPVGFVAEHVETLYDLDLEARKQAQALGLAWQRVATVDAEPPFIDALAEIVERAFARGPFAT